MAKEGKKKGGGFDWGNVQTKGEMFPRSFCRMEITDAEEAPLDDGRLAYRVNSEVLKPKQLAGRKYRDLFVIGVDKDLEAKKPETWNKSFAATNLKAIFTKCGVPLKGHPSDLIGELEGCKFTIGFSSGVAKKGKNEGRVVQYVDYFEDGEREYEIIEEGATRKGRSEKDDDGDDDDDNDDDDDDKSSKKSSKKSGKKSSKKDDDDDDGDDDDDSDDDSDDDDNDSDDDDDNDSDDDDDDDDDKKSSSKSKSKSKKGKR